MYQEDCISRIVNFNQFKTVRKKFTITQHQSQIYVSYQGRCRRTFNSSPETQLTEVSV